MNAVTNSSPSMPIRRLHNYAYCPRLFYYQWVENLFEENADTVAGSSVHRNVDVPSTLKDKALESFPEGTRCRSLRLESEVHRLVGVLDLVESGSDGLEIVDYKKGASRKNEYGERVPKEADALQVVAQALLLKETGQEAVRGWIYYAQDKQRVEVPLSEGAFERCIELLEEARGVAQSGRCPPPLRDDPRCQYCSAYPICLPEESAWWRELGLESPQMELLFEAKGTDSENSGELPKDLRSPRPQGDEGEILVVQTAGTMVGVRSGEICVSQKKVVLRKLPGRQVRAIYLYGAVQMSAQAMSFCLEHGIDVGMFSAAGRYLGSLQGLPVSGVDGRRGQYRMLEDRYVCLCLARECIRAKIHNQRVMLMRNGDSEDDARGGLAALRNAASRAEDLNSLLGVEGAAASSYFARFKTMLKVERRMDFDLSGRNRRPPRDPVNAMLSLGYSILAKELAGVLHTVGLDPFLGFMHQPRYGRPALALDLMEEFRPLIADSVAISLINRNEVGPEDFMFSASGVQLKPSGRKAFWEAWFRRMDTEVKHPEFGYSMSYRRMMEVQARQLWRFFRGECNRYHAFTTR